MTALVTTKKTKLGPADQASFDRAAVESLRARVAAVKAAEPAKPTVEQVRKIVSGVHSVTPLEDTARSLDLPAGVDAEKFVLDVVAKFGTWLAHSNGASGASVEYAANLEQLELLQPVSVGTATVLAPLGYEPWGKHKRDLGKALGAIASIAPDSDVIARFVSRTYATRTARLSYQLVVGVWNQAKHNRMDTVHSISDDLVFQAQLVEAYDLLDVARQDGVDAVIALLGADLDDLDAVQAHAVAGFWVAEYLMSTISRAAELAGSSQAARDRLRREVDNLRAAVEAAPDRYLPAGVRHLTLGQVQRICTVSGLAIHADNRGEEQEIRATLKEMGLGTDADRLVPEALRCAERGVLDQFWSIMTARIEGDDTWGEQLEELAVS